MSVATAASYRVGNVLALFPLFVGIIALAHGGVPQGLCLLAGAYLVSPRTDHHPILGVALIAAGLVAAA